MDDIADRLPHLEWARRQAVERGQDAGRRVPAEPDLINALVRDSEQTAWEAMEKLNKMQRDSRR